MLNVSKGNMYPFVSHTWNPIKGKCSHDCVYCYMKGFPQKPVRLEEKEFKTDLGKGNFIFVGSSTDDFAGDIPQEWINRTFEYCKKSDNKFLFQTKNPERFDGLILPDKSVIACTIETNRNYDVSKAPSVKERYYWMGSFSDYLERMISIEPIMDFDLDIFTEWIALLKPDFVSIGADSKRHYLPEPGPDKLEKFIKELRQFTKVIIKDNLKRLRQEIPEAK